MDSGWTYEVVLVGAILVASCSQSESPPSSFKVRAEREISGASAYPLPIDANRVGKYPADVDVGAGYFYDEVLEYRVWLHPHDGATPVNGDEDYFVAFAQYESAEAFSKKTRGAAPPVVLVRQLEWISEPKPGHFIPMKEVRTTEWQAPWLVGHKRTPGSIEEFMKNPRPVSP